MSVPVQTFMHSYPQAVANYSIAGRFITLLDSVLITPPTLWTDFVLTRDPTDFTKAVVTTAVATNPLPAVGRVLRTSGANEAWANGDFVVLSRESSLSVKVQLLVSASTASSTGTVAGSYAPIGLGAWSKVGSPGANSAIYKSAGTDFYLKVEQTGLVRNVNYITVRGYTGWDGTNLSGEFPTTAEQADSVIQISTASTGVVPWTISGDDLGFSIIYYRTPSTPTYSTGPTKIYFGELIRHPLIPVKLTKFISVYSAFTGASGTPDFYVDIIDINGINPTANLGSSNIGRAPSFLPGESAKMVSRTTTKWSGPDQMNQQGLGGIYGTPISMYSELGIVHGDIPGWLVLTLDSTTAAQMQEIYAEDGENYLLVSSNYCFFLLKCSGYWR